MKGVELDTIDFIGFVSGRRHPPPRHPPSDRQLSAELPLMVHDVTTSNLSISQHFLLIFPVLITPATPR
jgi:hypothetical protein